jgi:hypothetical protein
MRGEPLKEDEFYFLMANRIIKINYGASEYTDFMRYFYKDDIKQGYIDPTEPMPEPEAPKPKIYEIGQRMKVKQKLRIGNEVTPEEVKISYLKDEQKHYFQNNCPELFARFKP